MYRRPKFLEILLEIRREMALEADYDFYLFAEMGRSGKSRVKNSTRRTPAKIAGSAVVIETVGEPRKVSGR